MMRRLLSTIVLLATVIAVMAVTSVGTFAQRDRDRLDQVAVVDYWSSVADQARADIDAEMAELDAWLADDEVVLVRDGSQFRALSRTELERLFPTHVAVLLPRVGTDQLSADDLMRAIRTARLLGLTSGEAGIITPSGIEAETMGAAAEHMLAILGMAKGRLAEEHRARLEADRAEVARFVERLDEYRAQLDASRSGPDAGEIAAELGTYDEPCLWTTGYYVDHDHLDDMRVIAWDSTEPNGAGGPRFIYSVAWPEPGEEDPGRLLQRQEEALDELVGDGSIVYRGGVGGFCQMVESTCPGSRPNPCEAILGP